MLSKFAYIQKGLFQRYGRSRSSIQQKAAMHDISDLLPNLMCVTVSSECTFAQTRLSLCRMKLCPSAQFFNRASSQTLIAGRKSREREREGERKRDCMVLANGLFS